MKIKGAKGGSTPSGGTVQAPDSLHSIASAQILDLLSEGPIQGFKHGPTGMLQDVYFNETPVANSDGSLNFKNVKIDSRPGTQSQDYMQGFTDVESATVVNAALVDTANYTQAFTNLALSAVRITLSTPSLQQSNATTGAITGYSIDYAIDLSTDGGSFFNVISSSLTGKTTSTYERSHRIDLPPATVSGWVIRVRRLTVNQHSSLIADTVNVESYTTIIDAKLRYPNSAYVGTIISAEQFTSIPTRAFDMYGRIIQIPTNYNPTTRVYTGVWDGTFKLAWTNNPAWIFYDIVTHSRYGLGKLVTPAMINKWNLYTIAQYCDGMVSDGFGGTEPRFTCTLYLQAQADALKVLQDIASIFRGMAYWGAGSVTTVADQPADPTYTYANSNVVGGKFTYQGSRSKTRYTVALVSWNDPTDFGRAKVHYETDPAGVARYGIQTTQVIAVGCTSQGQAARLGQWILLTSRLETETVSFGVGLDGTLVPPGTIIRIADAPRAGKRQGGRIHSATTGAVTVDAVPLVAVGDLLTVALPSGVTQTQTVSGVAGNVISVSPAFSVAPNPEATWVVESATLAAQTFRVVSVVEGKNTGALDFAVTAVKHNASKFAAIDAGKAITIPPTSIVPPSVQPAPTTVTITAYPTTGAATVNTVMTIQWTSTPSATSYEVEYRKDSGAWQSVGIQLANACDVSGVTVGSYVARVRAINASNISSIATVSAPVGVADQTSLPTLVASIKTEADGAVASAAAANGELANIASDGIVSAAEKPTVIRDWSVISSEQAGIDAQAVSFLGAGSAQQVAYDNAITTLATYLGTLNTPKMWNDKTGDTNVVGVTFRANFNSVYITRQTLLNAIYANAQTRATNAQSTANTATTTANAAAVANLQNTQFTNGIAFWTPGTAPGWYPETGTANPDPAISTYVVHAGSSVIGGSASNDYLANSGHIPVQPGQTLTVMCCARAVGATGTAVGAIKISWRNAAGTEIGTVVPSGTPTYPTVGQPGYGTYLQCVPKAFGTAPAGASYALVLLLVSSHSTGYFTFSNIVFQLGPSSLDEVANSATYLKSLARSQGLVENGDFEVGAATLFPPPGWQGGSLVVGAGYTSAGYETGSPYSGSRSFYFTATQYLGLESIKTYQVTPGDYYAIGGATFSATAGAAVYALYFLSATNTSLGSISITNTTGWTYRTATGKAPAGAVRAVLVIANFAVGSIIVEFDSLFMARCSSYDNALAIASSGQTLGNQFNAPNSLTMAYGSVRSTTALTATSAGAVSVGAFTAYLGGASVSYNAVSNAVTGLTIGSTYQIYCHDAGGIGGTKTWYAATSVQLAMQQGDDVVLGGQVTIPSSGTSGGGGGGGCPVRQAWVLARRNGKPRWMRAGKVRVGDGLWLPREFRWGRVSYSEAKLVECARVDTAHDVPLSCSLTAPIGVATGVDILASRLLGAALPSVIKGIDVSDTVTGITSLGLQWVQHLTCEHSHFLVGNRKRRGLHHHNMKP